MPGEDNELEMELAVLLSTTGLVDEAVRTESYKSAFDRQLVVFEKQS